MEGNVNVELFRHLVATLAYRGGKALRGASPEFASFRAAEGTRTPGEILAHIGDLLEWTTGFCDGNYEWRPQPPESWEAGMRRFFDALAALDARLASGRALACPAEKMLQGPIADALTHVGQISLLRRMAGAPVRGENYVAAEIVVGRVGPEQAAARAEFG